MSYENNIEIRNCELIVDGDKSIIQGIGVAPLGSFSWALMRLKDGYKCKRRGWSNYVILYPGDDEPTFNSKPVRDCLAITTDDGKYQPGWTPSTEDLFAYDWEEC